MSKSDYEKMEERAKIASIDQSGKDLLEDPLLVVEFLLNSNRYAIESSFVSEAFLLPEITKLPGTPEYLLGLINKRGKVISVMDFRILLHEEVQASVSVAKVMVIQNPKMEFGFLVDEITGTKKLDPDTVKSAIIPKGMTNGNFFRGVTSEGTVILNADAILNDSTLIIDQK
jgi:purine-binding chemotaxis protein CheW